MRTRTVAWLAAGTFSIVAGHAQYCLAADVVPSISKEAEAARMGATFDWDIDRIRNDIEVRSGEVRYGADSSGAVLAVPTQQELAAKPVAELFDLCMVWNPALRHAAAGEIARRGSVAYELVLENAASPEADRRVASAQAIVGSLKHAQSMTTDSPERQMLVARLPELLSAITGLFHDRSVSVRQAVVPAYDAVGRLSRSSPATTKDAMPGFLDAGLEQACVETDAYVCQEFLITFSRWHAVWLPLLNPQTRAELLGKALLQQPFPRGRGATMRVISALSPTEIRGILPQILEDFRTPCLRDSMFFPGGRTLGFKLIVEHGEEAPEILEKAIQAASALNEEPWVSFSGRHRNGMRIFWDALGELGPRATSVLPSLEKLQREAEDALAAQPDKDSPRHKQAKEIAEYGRSIIAKIEQ